MKRTFALFFTASLLLPLSAHARRAQVSGDAAEQDMSPALLEDRIGGATGMGARARVPPLPPVFRGDADVRAALARARPEIVTCLETAGYVGTIRVGARIDRSRAITVTVTPRRADLAVRTCAELAAQRQLANLVNDAIPRTLRASISVRRRGAAVRPPRPVAPPSTPADAGLAGSVRARLDQDRGGLLQCLSAAAPGVVGRATLRVTLRPDGSLVLASASLPTGVPAGPALPCLSARISTLRFAPVPARPIAIEHTIELGL